MPLLPGAEPLSADGGPVGALVLHGFTGQPCSVKPWGQHLADAGLAVEVPRLPGHGTRWQDGPLAFSARHGAICYLDEVVEARQDTTVVIHPLTDNRRVLPLERKGELLRAHPDFLLVVSYNPGYQSLMKDLKQSMQKQ